jgi:hypothetical protein
MPHFVINTPESTIMIIVLFLIDTSIMKAVQTETPSGFFESS